jgi:branched-chain amino acid transport system substrate-binding protein
MSYVIGEYAAKHGIKNAYSVVADYAAGLDMEAAFKRGFTDNGGTMIGSDHTPLSTTDYLPAMQRVKAAKPQALFFFVVPGTGTIAFDKAYADADLAAAGVQLIGTGDVVPDDELEQVGPSINGMLNASLYSNDLKNPANEALLKAWHTEYGPTAVPSFESIAAWTGMGAIYSVVKQLGANATGDAALALLRTYKDPATPQGPIAIDPDTRDIICDVYLGKISKVDGHWANVPFDVIKNVKDHWKIINPPS